MPVLRTDLIANGSMLPDFSQLHARANGRPCSYQSCCKCHSFMQITARWVALIIRELCGTSARGEAKLVSSRDLVKYKCLTNSDLRFTYSRGEFQKFYCPVEFPYCIFVRNILLLRFSGPKSENNPLFCFSHFLMWHIRTAKCLGGCFSSWSIRWGTKCARKYDFAPDVTHEENGDVV